MDSRRWFVMRKKGSNDGGSDETLLLTRVVPNALMISQSTVVYCRRPYDEKGENRSMMFDDDAVHLLLSRDDRMEMERRRLKMGFRILSNK
jgi:hypothetical protein